MADREVKLSAYFNENKNREYINRMEVVFYVNIL